MERALIFLLVITLSGCLDSGSEGSPDGDAPEPTPDPDGQGTTDEPGRPDDPEVPDERIESGTFEGMDLEGIDCTNQFTVAAGPMTPARDRVPSDFDISDTEAHTMYYVYFTHCRSALLDGALVDDFQMANVHVAVHVMDDRTQGDENRFTLETFTNQQVVLDAWSRHGMEGHLATFSTEDGVAGTTRTIDAEGIRYAVTPAQPESEHSSLNAFNMLLYADDGTVGFDYSFSRPDEDAFPRAAVLSAEGGVLGEAFPGAGDALFNVSLGALRMADRAIELNPGS